MKVSLVCSLILVHTIELASQQAQLLGPLTKHRQSGPVRGLPHDGLIGEAHHIALLFVIVFVLGTYWGCLFFVVCLFETNRSRRGDNSQKQERKKASKKERKKERKKKRKEREEREEEKRGKRGKRRREGRERREERKGSLWQGVWLIHIEAHSQRVILHSSFFSGPAGRRKVALLCA